MSNDGNKEPVNPASPQTLTDDQIQTERKFTRRSLLAIAGTVIAGGAIGLLSDRRAGAQDVPPQTTDPNHPQAPPKTDPDRAKGTADPDHKKHKHHHKHHPKHDPDRAKGTPDPDRAKKPNASDPDPH